MSETHHDEHSGAHPAMDAVSGGLAVSAGGYTLEAAPTTFEAGWEEAFEVRVLDPAGVPYATSTSSTGRACT